MGASNVALVYTRWGELNHVPFRLLAYMALVSLDGDTPPRFWGGREALAAALGRQVPRDPGRQDTSDRAEADRRARRAAFEAVKVGLRQLGEVDAITEVKAGRIGQQAEYHLHLERQAQPSPLPEMPGAGTTGSAFPSRQAQPSPPEQAEPVAGAGSAFPDDRLSLPPRKSQEEQEQVGEEAQPESLTSPAPGTSSCGDGMCDGFGWVEASDGRQSKCADQAWHRAHPSWKKAG